MVTFVPGFVSQECAAWTVGLKAEVPRRGLEGALAGTCLRPSLAPGPTSATA
jgi:membrane dipeptidase